MLRWLFLSLLFLVLPLRAADVPRRVLLIHSFGRDFAPFNDVADRFRTELARQSPQPVEFLEASLEMARFDGVERDGPLLDFLAAIFKDHPPDLIVPAGAPAALFCQRHRSELFPRIPLLVIGADRRRVKAMAGTAEFTAVGLELDLAILLESITTVRPKTRHVYVVMGTSPVERFWEAELRQEWPRRAKNITFHWLSDQSLAQMQETVRTLPAESAILMGILNRDAAGIPHVFESGLASIHSAANAPVFGYAEPQLGRGIIGGRLLPMQQAGDEAAAVAVRLLAGTPASDIAPKFLPQSVPIYDARELKRWGIRESALPAGSTLRFRELGLWETHHKTVLGVLVIVVFQSILIGLLLHARRRARELDVSLAEQRRELAHLSRLTMLSTLSSSLAHELNQPLGIILSNAQAAEAILEGNAPDLAEVRHILADVVKADRRAGEVIMRLRAFLKRGEPNRQPHVMNEVVEDTVQLMRNDLITRGVAIECLLAPGLPLVHCDRVQLQQVILNLIMNASDAMVNNEPDTRRITITSHVIDGCVRISIRDAGCGLPADVESIFQPLVTTKKQGLGLGLAISRSIAESHGGKLWAEARNPGAVFHLDLPIEEVAR